MNSPLPTLKSLFLKLCLHYWRRNPFLMFSSHQNLFYLIGPTLTWSWNQVFKYSARIRTFYMWNYTFALGCTNISAEYLFYFILSYQEWHWEQILIYNDCQAKSQKTQTNNKEEFLMFCRRRLCSGMFTAVSMLSSFISVKMWKFTT